MDGKEPGYARYRDMKKVVLIVGLGSIALLLILVAIIYPKKAWMEKGTSVPSEATLPYKTEWNFRQSKNACGPYSAAAVIRRLTNKDTSSDTISQGTSWRYHGYTLPFGVAGVIRRNGLSADEFISTGSNKDRILWLHFQIAHQRPVIILGRKNGLLHYITLLGYQRDQFNVYDSLEEKGATKMTVDRNDSLPGNINWTDDELLTFWSQGGLFGIYQYYAIVAHTN